MAPRLFCLVFIVSLSRHVLGADLAGSNPSCPGQNVTFTCSIVAPAHRWDIMAGSMSYSAILTSVIPAADAGPFQLAVTSAVTGSVNETTATVTSSPGIDGATLSCDPAGTAVGDPQNTTAQVVGLSVAGVSATPQPSLTSVEVIVQPQDSRTATVCQAALFNVDVAVVRGSCPVINTHNSTNTGVAVGGLNLCRCQYTFTAFITTDFDDGAMSQPVPHADPDFSQLIIAANVTPSFSNSAVLTLSESIADCVESYSITWGGVSFTATSGSTSLTDLTQAVPVCDGSQITVTPNTGLGPVNSRRITWQLTALQSPSNLGVQETILTWTNPNTVDSINVFVGTGASEEACSNSYEQIMPSVTSHQFPANSGPFYCVQFVIMDCIANATFDVNAPVPGTFPLGAIAGIVIAAIIIAVVIIVALVLLVKAYRRSKNEEELSGVTIALIVLGLILLLLTLIGIAIAIVLVCVWLCSRLCDDSSEKLESRRSKLVDEDKHEMEPVIHDPNALYSNPTEIRHEAAPESHDEYAMLDTHTKKKPKPPAPKAQESGELQKQVGPEGDVYTVPKRGSSKKKQESPPPSHPPASEEQLAEMYATPDMTQKGRNKNTAPPLVYADIGVSASSRAAPVPPAGQVTYSTIAGTEPGPVEVVVEPTYAN